MFCTCIQDDNCRIVQSCINKINPSDNNKKRMINSEDIRKFLNIKNKRYKKCVRDVVVGVFLGP